MGLSTLLAIIHLLGTTPDKYCGMDVLIQGESIEYVVPKKSYAITMRIKLNIELEKPTRFLNTKIVEGLFAEILQQDYGGCDIPNGVETFERIKIV